ncbi:MAG: superoxide dismutase family protein [Fidelibacterota bacterium]|nr:MAG: superoxide dismutase family protein [Candidatus Neomarinimicrobiota bacterium]
MKVSKQTWVLIPFTLILIGAWSCRPESGAAADQSVTKVVAVLHPLGNAAVSGTVTFTRTDGGVHVVAHVNGLEPGLHGFHIHEFGDCSAPDGTSAGGHFNPEGSPHAGPESTTRHLGDLGNLSADDTGHAHLDVVDPHLRLEGPHAIIGRAVIVHAQADDLTSQPTGAAGARIACGVIGLAGK